MVEYAVIGSAIVLALIIGSVLMQQVLQVNISSTIDGVSSPTKELL